MTPEEIARYRALLVEHRAALRGQGSLKPPPIRVDAVGKVDEDAQPLAEMSQVIASRRNQARAGSLKGVEAAIKRLDREPEEFGRCVECDEHIAGPRLGLMPWARLCVGCQSEREELAAGRRGRRHHLTDYD